MFWHGYEDKMCHFVQECHCFGLCVNCFENVEFELTAASKQSRKTVNGNTLKVSTRKCADTIHEHIMMLLFFSFMVLHLQFGMSVENICANW